jgi:hypothetical protein
MIIEGSDVEWTSQSSGYLLKKRGMILAFVPSGASIAKILSDNGLDDPYKDETGGDTSSKDRYLVAVFRVHRKTGKDLMPAYYAPLASVVDRQNTKRVA